MAMPSAPRRRSLASLTLTEGQEVLRHEQKSGSKGVATPSCAVSSKCKKQNFSPSEASPAFCNSDYSCRRRTPMKRVALLVLLVGWLVPLASVQDHFQVGGYGDYFRISQTKTNM